MTDEHIVLPIYIYIYMLKSIHIRIYLYIYINIYCICTSYLSSIGILMGTSKSKPSNLQPPDLSPGGSARSDARGSRPPRRVGSLATLEAPPQWDGSGQLECSILKWDHQPRQSYVICQCVFLHTTANDGCMMVQ